MYRSTSRRSDSLPRTGSRSGLTSRCHEEAFASLAPHIITASSRQEARLAATHNVQAALDLHEREKQQSMSVKRSEVAKAQFFLAATKMFVSRLQWVTCQGPHARHETKDAERLRWVRHLADLLAESPTPIEEALRSKPGDTSLPGAGKRVSTLRKPGPGSQEIPGMVMRNSRCHVSDCARTASRVSRFGSGSHGIS